MSYYEVKPDYMWNELKGKSITRSQLVDFACTHKVFDFTIEELVNKALEGGAIIIDLPKILNKKGSTRVKKEVGFNKEDLMAACRIHGCDYSKKTLGAIMEELEGQASSTKQIANFITSWKIKDSLEAEKKGLNVENKAAEAILDVINANKEESANTNEIIDKEAKNELINKETKGEVNVTKGEEKPVSNVGTQIDKSGLGVNPGPEESIAPETRFWPTEIPQRKPGTIGKLLKVAAVFGSFSNLLYSFDGEKIIVNGKIPTMDPKDMDKLADELLEVQQFFTSGAEL